MELPRLRGVSLSRGRNVLIARSPERALALVALVVLGASLAGCLDEATSTLGGRVVARGEDPRLSDAWSYDGSALRNARGFVEVDVNDRSNEGSVTAELDDGRDQWRLAWTDFRESRAFHDGGIATDFAEHGDSGVGDASVPRVDLAAAGWGEAQLYRNGVAVPDPFTGNATLRAHFMIAQGALRAEDGVIYNATREQPYDPNRPGDGSVASDGNQIFVTLASHETAPPYRFFLVMEFPTVTLGEEAPPGALG